MLSETQKKKIFEKSRRFGPVSFGTAKRKGLLINSRPFPVFREL